MMTEKDLCKLLSDINKNKAGGEVITRPLSDTVDYAKIWPENRFSAHRQQDGELEPLTAYLIHAKGEQYMAAVLAAESLKWYVFPQYRKGKEFLNFLREVVIPHSLQHKPMLRISLNRSEYSLKEYAFIKKTALAAGFKAIRENDREIRMAIEAASLGKREYISGKNTGISQKRKQEITADILLFLQKLKIFKTEIELKTGDIEYAEDIKEIAKALKELKIR